MLWFLEPSFLDRISPMKIALKKRGRINRRSFFLPHCFLKQKQHIFRKDVTSWQLIILELCLDQRFQQVHLVCKSHQVDGIHEMCYSKVFKHLELNRAWNWCCEWSWPMQRPTKVSMAWLQIFDAWTSTFGILGSWSAGKLLGIETCGIRGSKLIGGSNPIPCWVRTVGLGMA